MSNVVIDQKAPRTPHSGVIGSWVHVHYARLIARNRAAAAARLYPPIPSLTTSLRLSQDHPG